jgi:exosortase H (IPTLxxWG-CTERM-specific)
MSSAASIGTRQAIARNMRPARFGVIFVTCFFLGIGLLLTPPVQAVDARFSRLLVKLSAGVIRVCGGNARVEGVVLRDPSTGFAIQMLDGCNAVNVTILLWSAVLAFPACFKMKFWGLMAGSTVIHVVNIVRFISLFYIGQYSASWFEFAHAYLWESLLILDTMVVFWLWVNRVSRSYVVANTGR